MITENDLQLCEHTLISDVDTMVRTMQPTLHSVSNGRRETIDDDIISEDI